MRVKLHSHQTVFIFYFFGLALANEAILFELDNFFKKKKHLNTMHINSYQNGYIVLQINYYAASQ